MWNRQIFVMDGAVQRCCLHERVHEVLITA
jgi:hypothetical protein